MKDSGSLVIRLEFNPRVIHGARVSIPLLGVDEHMGRQLELDGIPSGTYTGTITLFRTTGAEIKKAIKLRVQQGQQNIHDLNFTSIANEVLIRPVDSRNHTILFSELKIESVDPNFRLVRDEGVLPCKLSPGTYQLKMILPDLRVKAFPLKVTDDMLVYTIPVEEENSASTRHEPRFHLSVPVVYRTNDGRWISTNSTNISSTGICLVKGLRKIKDRELYVRLFVPASRVPLECYAKVRWTRDEDTPDSRMGLQLLLPEISKANLEKWLVESAAPRR